jgi:uncharacterized protein YbjT (DUF2867 family)
MDNYTDPAFGVQAGTLATALEPGTIEQLIAADDIGAFAALAFARPGSYLGKTIEIAGDELTPGQIAAALSQASGHQIPYLPVPAETIRQASPDAADAFTFLNTHGYAADIAASRKLHPGLMTFSARLAGPGAGKLAELFTQQSSASQA